MNKGKPSGFEADAKKDAGAKSTSRPRRGQAGVGPEWTNRRENAAKQLSNAPIPDGVGEGGGAAEAINPFPEIRNGASTSGAGKSRIVQFEFTDGKAEKVCVAGTFNNWHPNASEMIRIEGGKWRKDLSLSPGEYEYRFVIDGKWITDPRCPYETPNGFGENNSVLLVPEA